MKTMIKPPGRARRLAPIVAITAAITLFGGAQAALADPSPNAGPTVGGTVVSDQTPPGVDFTVVSTGQASTTALGSDGLVYSWGRNNFGQLGNGTTADSSIPVVVSTPAGVTFTSIAVGNSHALAVGSDGLVYAWGLNNYGQLGDGTTANHNAPAVVASPPGLTFTEVAASGVSSYALASDGTAYAWGQNLSGKLGNGSTADSAVPVPVPVQMPVGVTFTKISASAGTGSAIASNGSVYSWGDNSVGTIGDGTTANRLTPTLVKLPIGVTATSLSSGQNHKVVQGSDGQIYTWGLGVYGQIGNGTTTFTNPTPVPVSVPAGVEFASVLATGNSTYALTPSGIAYSWGYNANGQLGDGTTTSRSLPGTVQMPGGITFTVLSSGGTESSHVVAQGSDGNTYAWGLNSFGQVGDGTTTQRTAPVLISRDVEITGVTFAGVPGTNLTQANGTWSVTTPPGCGVVDVVVSWTLFGAQGSQSYPGGFVYGTAPEITEQPASTVVSAGSMASLAADADGDSAPTVQWQSAATPDGPWTNIDGATSVALDAAPTATTSYRAVFTNCNGEAITQVATIEVQTTTVVTNPPSGGAVGPRVNTGGDLQNQAPADMSWLVLAVGGALVGGTLAAGIRWALKASV